MKQAFVFYAWFQGSSDFEPFIARVLDNTSNPNSWRIDNHDKTYMFALKEAYIKEATHDEINIHVNRKSN
jgi:hypothetical protein